MSPTREHLAGLRLALSQAEDATDMTELVDCLNGLIGQAQAAPQTEPVRWTGHANADMALILLGRIDAPEDEARIEQLEQIVMDMGRELLAKADHDRDIHDAECQAELLRLAADQFREERDHLRAEVERLRAALNGIAAADWSCEHDATDHDVLQIKSDLIWDMQKRARAALAVGEEG